MPSTQVGHTTPLPPSSMTAPARGPWARRRDKDKDPEQWGSAGVSKRTPEEWTVSWRRLGGTENSVGTPACRSHPLRRVLEAYLQETQRPLCTTRSDAGDRCPPRPSLPKCWAFLSAETATGTLVHRRGPQRERRSSQGQQTGTGVLVRLTSRRWDPPRGHAPGAER